MLLRGVVADGGEGEGKRGRRHPEAVPCSNPNDRGGREPLKCPLGCPTGGGGAGMQEQLPGRGRLSGKVLSPGDSCSLSSHWTMQLLRLSVCPSVLSQTAPPPQCPQGSTEGTSMALKPPRGCPGRSFPIPSALQGMGEPCKYAEIRAGNFSSKPRVSVSRAKRLTPAALPTHSPSSLLPSGTGFPCLPHFIRSPIDRAQMMPSPTRRWREL